MNRDPQELEPRREADGEPRLDDLEVYRLLLSLASRTGRLSARCWSTAAATALTAASRVLRALASALYRANLDP